eukprot:15132369-Alexandrium_andersonii.AAC.1
MKGPVAPEGPQGETPLFRVWNRRKVGGPSVAPLGAGGAMRSAAPVARSAGALGSPTFGTFRAR